MDGTAQHRHGLQVPNQNNRPTLADMVKEHESYRAKGPKALGSDRPPLSKQACLAIISVGWDGLLFTEQPSLETGTWD